MMRNAKISSFLVRLYMVADGRVVTSSRQIIEVKQCQAQLALRWMTNARVTLPAMCRGIGQVSNIMPPLCTHHDGYLVE